MRETLQSLKTQFVDDPAIVNLVSTRCSFVVELQEQQAPFIAYNLREDEFDTKDASKQLMLVIAVVSKSIEELLTIYETAKTVIDTKTTDFLTVFEGSSFPDTVGKDDHYIIELNYKIQTH